MTQKPVVMIVGDYMWHWYQEACAEALESLGVPVHRFSWFDDFRHWVEGQSEPVYHSIWHRLQCRQHWGPVVWRIERRLLKEAVHKEPDIIWFYNVHIISARTIKKLKQLLPNATLVQYANDNPFSPKARHELWRNFIEGIPHFDVHFSYRKSNLDNYKAHGARNVHLLRPYFIPEEDYPVRKEQIPDHFKREVVFAGHYEDDGRVEMLEAICRTGYKLNLFGGGWDAASQRLRTDSPLRAYFPITPVIGDEYRYAICGAKVALCILSTLNQDTYTRRSFQVPAMRTAMLSQYTEDMASLYMPDKEVVFFKNKQELLDKLGRLLTDDSWRESVAEAGYAKVYAAGHDVKSRMQEWMRVVSGFTGNEGGMNNGRE